MEQRRSSLGRSRGEERSIENKRRRKVSATNLRFSGVWRFRRSHSSMNSLVWMKEQKANFGFGFNNIDFSDRALRLEISPSGGDKEWTVKTVHISCILLAGNSPFFLKLFNRESQKKDDITLKLHASEEAAFMDMLKYIYGKPMNAATVAELLDVLVAADKFEVITCMTRCVELLLMLHITTVEHAVSYLELPSSVLASEVTLPLIDAANRHLVSHFESFNESHQEQLMSLPLCAVKVVLGRSDDSDLQVNSEDIVLDFILKWARLHYPQLEERRNILTKHLVRLMCFPCMSYLKLMEIVELPEFDYEQVSRLVLKALSCKIELLESREYVQRTVLSSRHLYYPRRVIHFDIKKQGYANMLRIQTLVICVESICLGGRSFSIYAKRCTGNSSDLFELYLGMKATRLDLCSLDIELAVMDFSSKEFLNVATTKHTVWNPSNIQRFYSTNSIRDDSLNFIDGVLHLRAQLSIVK